MNKIACALLCLIVLSACDKKNEPSTENFTKGMNAYMEQHGDFCLAKTTWPIDVSQNEMDTHSGRNALQMPVLEKAGLVKSSIATVDFKDEDTGATKPVKVMRYDMTDEGKKYYLTKAIHRRAADGNIKTIQGDFCPAKLSLDKVVGWEVPKKGEDGKQMTTVTYTFNVKAAPWTSNADIQKVFPVVAYIVNGAQKVQLKEGFVLTPSGWQAVDN